ncbi:uncharacterized protein B0H18DRAFT_209709 [Fomitopsis serialis]|uniref:uncharacterized protein n=1 Tax=Fomitopsis serialis TaxID=139415 RepID=UPI002008D2B4|nr:uncharacterized protein B0H18DRAFT_209709 [Neoantrodia serialis]KAH9929400.1 hypothetical protein B0H18DRAFT_209709 [Neoantrodia serialis]
MLATSIVAVVLTALVPTAACAELFQWFSDYDCKDPVNGACIASDGGCCTPPYPPGINSVYVSATDDAAEISFTIYANANCQNPVDPILQYSGSGAAGTGCYNAANAAVGSTLGGEEE